ncbi:MAG: PH domain-containing protein, partial [Candidatus Methylomirabilia bacterium]
MSDEEQVLREARPSWWNFFWYWVFFWLLIPVIVALWKRASVLLRVYEDRVVLERGVLSKNIKVVFITDIRTIDIRQSLVQRVLKIGTIMIAT